jgi:hypothetical protein
MASDAVPSTATGRDHPLGQQDDIGWLGLPGRAMISTLGLIADVVLGDGWALLVGVAAGLGFVLLWFVMPYRRMAHL